MALWFKSIERLPANSVATSIRRRATRLRRRPRVCFCRRAPGPAPFQIARRYLFASARFSAWASVTGWRPVPPWSMTARASTCALRTRTSSWCALVRGYRCSTGPAAAGSEVCASWSSTARAATHDPRTGLLLVLAVLGIRKGAHLGVSPSESLFLLVFDGSWVSAICRR